MDDAQNDRGLISMIRTGPLDEEGAQVGHANDGEDMPMHAVVAGESSEEENENSRSLVRIMPNKPAIAGIATMGGGDDDDDEDDNDEDEDLQMSDEDEVVQRRINE